MMVKDKRGKRKDSADQKVPEAQDKPKPGKTIDESNIHDGLDQGFVYYEE
jgi:hypothetical protein